MSETVEFHTELQQLAKRYMLNDHGTTIEEFRLPNGRIADLFTVTGNGSIIITEVKTLLTNTLVTSAIEKYSRFCEQIYIAAPEGAVYNLHSGSTSLYFGSNVRKPGFLALKGGRVSVYRHCPSAAMSQMNKEYLIQRFLLHPAFNPNVAQSRQQA